MSSSKNKGKDKGKEIRKADDYQLEVPIQIPTHNQFHALTNFPPLPYKTVIATPPSKPTLDNSYVVRHTEHLFLTNYKSMPSSEVIKPLVQKAFGSKHFAADHSQKTQQFYEPILVDTKSIEITHTFDKMNQGCILFSKCIIRQVLSTEQWKNPFEEKNFSIPYTPQTYDYNDYRMAWFRAFLHRPETHSWFFNFHDNCPTQFPIWFYYQWTWFDCSLSVLPHEAQGGWDFWEKNVSSLEAYTKDVQFFRIFNIAWIFSWEYRLQNLLKNSFPLSLVHVYKIKWWNEFKTKLCFSEKVEHFCGTTTKKCTLQNLRTFEPKAGTGPSTPQNKESSKFYISTRQGIIPKGEGCFRIPQGRSSDASSVLAKDFRQTG